MMKPVVEIFYLKPDFTVLLPKLSAAGNLYFYSVMLNEPRCGRADIICSPHSDFYG